MKNEEKTSTADTAAGDDERQTRHPSPNDERPCGRVPSAWTSRSRDPDGGRGSDRAGPPLGPRGGQPSRADRSSWRRRSGSARMSMATIRRPLTVKAPTENGSPSRIETMPADAVDQRRPDDAGPAASTSCAWPATAAAPRTTREPAERPEVRAQHDVRVEHREQRLEVAVARRGEEGVDDLALRLEVGVGHGVLRPGRGGAPGWRAGAPPPASGRRSARSRRTARRTCRAARRRAARRGSASRARRAARARPSRRAAPRAPGRCRPRGPRSGRARGRRAAPRAAHAARAQHVQGDARDHGGQPAAEVLDLVGVRRGSAAARPPGRRRRPRSASRASGRPPPAGGSGAPRSAPPARSRSSIGHVPPSPGVIPIDPRARGDVTRMRHVRPPAAARHL